VDPLGPALEDPVAPRDLRGGVDRVAAAGRQEDLGVVHRRERGEPRRELVGGPVGEVAERLVGREPLHLRRDRARDVAPAVAEVRVPEARGRVDVALAVGVPDVDPLAALDQEL
jgi:hypothetical protein